MEVRIGSIDSTVTNHMLRDYKFDAYAIMQYLLAIIVWHVGIDIFAFGRLSYLSSADIMYGQ